jgi:hypothetical protein
MQYVVILNKPPNDVASTTVEAESIADACVRAKDAYGQGWEVTDAHKSERAMGVPQEIFKHASVGNP